MSGIESIMSREVVRIGLNATVREAASSMRAHNLGALVVVQDDGRIHGVLTERDVLNRLVAAGRDADGTKVSEVCTRDPVTVKADEPVETCYRLLREQGFRHLPIRNDDNEPVGIVSARDFMWGLLAAAPNANIEEVCRKLDGLDAVMSAADTRYSLD